MDLHSSNNSIISYSGINCVLDDSFEVICNDLKEKQTKVILVKSAEKEKENSILNQTVDAVLVTS